MTTLVSLAFTFEYNRKLTSFLDRYNNNDRTGRPSPKKTSDVINTKVDKPKLEIDIYKD